MPISNIDPERVLSLLRKRGKNKLTSAEFDKLLKKSHNKSFTIAKLLSADLLQEYFDLIEKAKKEGWTLEEFQKEALPSAEKSGWTGNTKHRLKIIYKTNLDVAYAQGKFEEQQKLFKEGLRPYLKWMPSTSEERNPLHEQFYGLVLRFDDPFWKIFYPPCRYGCECSVRAVSQKEVDEEKIVVSSGANTLLKIIKDPELKKELDLQRKSKISIFDEISVNEKKYNKRLGKLLNVILSNKNAKK